MRKVLKRLVSETDEKYYTYMLKILNSIGGKSLDVNWLITNIEAYPQENGEFKNIEPESGYIFISNSDLIDMLEKNNFQWIWGCFSAFPINISLEEILKYELPYNMNNYEIHKEKPIIQHPLAIIEINAEDACSVSITATDDKYIDLFKTAYTKSKDDWWNPINE